MNNIPRMCSNYWHFVHEHDIISWIETGTLFPYIFEQVKEIWSKRKSFSWAWANLSLLMFCTFLYMALKMVCYDVTSRQLTWHGDIFDDIQNSFSDVSLPVVMICSLPITKHLQEYWNSSKVDSLWGTTLCKRDETN